MRPRNRRRSGEACVDEMVIALPADIGEPAGVAEIPVPGPGAGGVVFKGDTVFDLDGPRAYGKIQGIEVFRAPA